MEQQLLCYKTLPEWNSDTLPEAFRQRHNTQSGTWAKLTVLSGSLTFAMMTEDGATTETWQFSPESQPPFIAPQQWHRIVSFDDDDLPAGVLLHAGRLLPQEIRTDAHPL